MQKCILCGSDVSGPNDTCETCLEKRRNAMQSRLEDAAADWTGPPVEPIPQSDIGDIGAVPGHRNVGHGDHSDLKRISSSPQFRKGRR